MTATKSKVSSDLSILIGSFNTHKLYPPSDINLSSWLIYPHITPQIIAIGLQELPLAFTTNQQKSEYQWIELIEKTLPNYRLLSHGFMNIYGNKGSVGIRFEFDRTSLCFLNCHLSAGENLRAFQLRNEQYSAIHQRMLFKSSNKNLQWNINEHNGLFLFGDLNYRQTEDNKEELKEKTNILKTYSELSIKFPPTYKYKLNSDTYNSLRRSSWTDRILYRNHQCRIEPIDYWTTSMIRFSDHRPIAKLFSLSRLIR
ncbi:hypothetical protein I4U23_008071 [Adineta vaga]|nr:hypothetical protein I4U23_008071 [Adineta vaga]